MASPPAAQGQPIGPSPPAQTLLARLLTTAARPLPMRVRRAALYRLQRLQSWMISLDPDTPARHDAMRTLLATALDGSGRDIDTVLREVLRTEDRRLADQVAAAAWPAEARRGRQMARYSR